MFEAAESRYDTMRYNRCGKSGIKLPAISLGLWHNFGAITDFETQQKILRAAFDQGITHFDLANNYGPPYGEAERNFGIHMDRLGKEQPMAALAGRKRHAPVRILSARPGKGANRRGSAGSLPPGRSPAGYPDPLGLDGKPLAGKMEDERGRNPFLLG